MTGKIAVGIIVLLLLIAGGYLVLAKNNKATAPTVTPTSMQMHPTSQAQTSPASSSATMAKNEVTIENFAFSPKTITVKVGDSITWTNKDTAGHSATADDNSFDTGVLSQGQSGSVTFKKAGTFTYHCSVHPNMKATVVVE